MDNSIKLFFNISFLLILSFHTILNALNHPDNSKMMVVSGSIENVTAVTDSCVGVHNYEDQTSKCAYIKLHPEACRGNGYINYLLIFYCSYGDHNMLGLNYFSLFLWVILLFYLLGNTSTEYFCPSVESLSKELKLSPTIAGTTLLPFGNGANDVFASIISFTKSKNGDVGLNSVLGGAFFISCFVLGILCFSISDKQTVDEGSFIRDVLFLIFSLSCLLLIFVFGKINLLGALAFVSIYLLYICTVSVMHVISKKRDHSPSPSIRTLGLLSHDPNPADPVVQTSKGIFLPTSDNFTDMSTPLLGYVDEEKAIPDQDDQNQKKKGFNIVSILELPLYLPRRLTIPVINKEKWSKPFAISSAILDPILLATLWNTQMEGINFKITLAIYLFACFIGIILGNIVFVFTENSSPPKKCLLPWLVGGFLMSITWTYLLVEELVASLVAIGTIFKINPSILGLTILAWGNSVGDLISNLAMALHGGSSGAQMAMSSCYAGPLFNTLIGLGLSLVFASWYEYPYSYVFPSDDSLYETLGFFIMGLLWALVILPKRNMQLDRYLGGGLFAIYFCFLFLRFARAFG